MKIIFSLLMIIPVIAFGQTVYKTSARLPDTGQNMSYTNTFGEDNDYSINVPYFNINGDGTVTDTVTMLMWQQNDGGEMTYEQAKIYCDSLTLGGFTDWRLPKAHEAYTILNHQYSNPALDTKIFIKTSGEYWWSADMDIKDTTRIWVTNSGGGIGNHPRKETVSAGGTKKIHVRAVRITKPATLVESRFTDNKDGTITDNLTNLIWQKSPHTDSLTWEQALNFAENLSLAGKLDWRLPNIKELQSITDFGLNSPAVSTIYFPTIGIKTYWTSTTLPNQNTQAWYLDTRVGITTHDNKTTKRFILCVRGTGKNNEVNSVINNNNNNNNNILMLSKY